MCQPAPHAELAARFLREGTPVVSISDDLDDLRVMLGLGDVTRRGEVPLVVGTGMAPGLSGLLARYLSTQLHVVDELHIANHGTAGPACARQHHHALGTTALGWHDGEWIEPPGGSGRDLVWFPEPIKANDCYRAALGDPLLLHRAFPEVSRISARVSATRRDRLTARLPMLTPPHPQGDLGAVRVEARGAAADGSRVTVIAGAVSSTARLTAAVAAVTAMQVLHVGLEPGVHSLADQAIEPLDLLHHATEAGVQVQEYTGLSRATNW
jgi:saccharopine dehydrogenase-like NADP-dependent oxidoreductase